MNTCTVEGCAKQMRRGRICSMHRERFRRHGSYDPPAEPPHWHPRCSVPDCERGRPYRHGLCTLHHGRMKAHGTTDKPRRPTADERFNALWKLDPGTGCHVWQGTLKGGTGYGGFWFGRPMSAHVYAYVRKYGPVPAGLVLDHFVCSRRSCVNPDHMRPVTQRENSLRCDSPAAANAGRTHCTRGHEFSPENTYIRKDNGGRVCRVCSNLRKRRDRPTTVAGRRRMSTKP